MKALREKERQGRIFESSNRVEMDSDLAATNLQRMLKGFISRTEATRERKNELMFIGMIPRRDNLDQLERELHLSYVKRKQEQLENKEGYEKACILLTQMHESLMTSLKKREDEAQLSIVEMERLSSQLRSNVGSLHAAAARHAESADTW